MPKINVLPKHIADLIAAGEVVERPYSVIKELMENSIDADASAITVEIKHGGITYMRVTDNGSGIERNDVQTAFKSHATSKLRSEEDLLSIGTLGFRGEALPSISAVSRMEIMTRTEDEPIGTHLVMEGSEQILLDDAGCPKGTTIVVRDLFFNVPARMKFLKKDVTEGNSVAGVVDRLALSHPEVSIRFIRDGKEVLLTSGNGDLLSTIYAVFGRDFSGGLVTADYELNGVQIKGFISKPLAARSNRSMQFFFLNGRLVKCQTASIALEQAYKNAIMVGKFPSCVLHINVPLESVDVNVHPAKTEVRFENEKKIFDAVYYAAKNSIDKKDTPSQIHFAKLKNSVLNKQKKAKAEQLKIPQKSEDFWADDLPKEYKQGLSDDNQLDDANKILVEQKNKKLLSDAAELGYRLDDEDALPLISQRAENLKESAAISAVSPPDDVAAFNQKSEDFMPATQENEAETFQLTPPESRPEIDFKVVGEAFKTYIIVECAGKLLIIDKHAAHERMLYEKIKEQRVTGESQMLLSPVTVTLSKEEYSVVLENRQMLFQAGFDVEDFGSGSVLVRACPLVLSNEDVALMMTELADYLMTSKELVPEKLDWIYHSTACRAAIKGGDKTSDYELLHFVKALLADSTIRYCPHGRPVFIEMTKRELEKQFGRV